MRLIQWQLVPSVLGRCLCAFSTVLMLGAVANGQVIYNVNANTNFGSNTANAGAGPTFSDSDSDGFFELAHAADSGNNNAIFIDSSDGNASQTINALTMASLGRGLQTTDTVVFSGTVAPTDIAGNFYDSVANGFEMGIHAGTDATGATALDFRSNPNILMQLRATNQASGTAAFFEYVGNTDNSVVPPVPAGINSRNQAIPALAEGSLNDGFSFSVAYSATDIVFTATDVDDFGTLTPTSVSYTFTHGVDATSSGSITGFDFLTDVGDGFAYFSQQKSNSGLANQSIEFSNFQVEVQTAAVPEPSSAVALAFGALGFFVRRRRA